MTQVTEHGGGVWSLRVPIPDNPLGHTLVHVLDTDRGPVLVDTGWDDPASWGELTAGLRALDLDVSDVHGVVITHHHPDHHGLSGRVREESGAWIAMHAADTAVVRRTRASEPGTWLDYLARKLATMRRPGGPHRPAAGRADLRAHGHPARSALRDPRPRDRPRRAARPGRTAGCARSGPRATPPATSASTWRRITLPAPRPRPALLRRPSAARDLPAHRAVRGPRRLPRAHGSVRGPPGDPLGDYLDSLERVGRLGVAEVLPAHQHAFTDAATGSGNCSTTTRTASPDSSDSSPSRSPPGSSPSGWSGTAPGGTSPTDPGTSPSARPKPTSATW